MYMRCIELAAAKLLLRYRGRLTGDDGGRPRRFLVNH
jgi:hypothetical protein